MNERKQELQDLMALYRSPEYRIHLEEIQKLLSEAQKDVNIGGKDNYDRNIGRMEGITKCANIVNKLKKELKKLGENNEN